MPAPLLGFIAGKGDNGKKPLTIAPPDPAVVAARAAVEEAVLKDLGALTKTLFIDEGTDAVVSPEDVDEQFSTTIDLAHHLRTERPELYERYYPEIEEAPPMRKRYPFLFCSQIRRLQAEAIETDEKAFYYVPGLAASKLNWQRPKRGVGRPRAQYDCPNPECGAVLPRIEELAHHLTAGCCIPERGFAAMQRNWAKTDGEALALADPPVYMDAQEALKIADRPQMSRYRWPQDQYGIWCLTENTVRNAFGSDVGLDHTELDYRWVGENERNFLLENAVIAKTAPKQFRVYKSSEIHRLVELAFPTLRARYMKYMNDETAVVEDAEGGQLEDDEGGAHGGAHDMDGSGNETPFEMGSMTVARQRAFAAVRQAARYNRVLGYERTKERTEYFDYNTQICQIPSAKRLRLEPAASGGTAGAASSSGRPVAVVAGQFQDGYRRYTTADEASVLYNSANSLEGAASFQTSGGGGGGSSGTSAAKSGRSNRPMTQLELVQQKIAGRREGIAGTKPMRAAPHDAFCSFCMMTHESNPAGQPEELVACATCDNCGHPSCLQLDQQLTETIKTYQWQCIDCRTCSICRAPHDDDKMLFCDSCDRGYHTYCVSLASPPKGRWVCHLCGVCESCGTTSPGPPGSKWKHEYHKPKDGAKKEFLQTLCVSCSSLFRRGDFCPSCLVVHRTEDLDLPMVSCDSCDRWIHAECDGITDDEYEKYTDEGGYYECLLCRGEQAERCDKFHKKKLKGGGGSGSGGGGQAGDEDPDAAVMDQ